MILGWLSLGVQLKLLLTALLLCPGGLSSGSPTQSLCYLLLRYKQSLLEKNQTHFKNQESICVNLPFAMS